MSQQQRRRYFIDRSVQGRLVISLIVLELLIFGSAMWFVYADLQHLVDTDLYRIHQVQSDSLPVLVNSLMHLLPWVVLVNVFALIIADKIWAGYIRRIVIELEQYFSDLKKLCIMQPEKIKGEHEVIAEAKDWLRYEYQRNQSIRELVSALPKKAGSLDASEREKINETLNKIQKLLS